MNKNLNISYRKANPKDLPQCTRVRGLTRDNPLDEATLRSIGVTDEIWGAKIDEDTYVGWVAQHNNQLVGFCFADSESGEILVLAILAEFDGLGIGRQLLNRAVNALFEKGFDKLWLAAAPDPKMRAYGFYRHLGWISTGTYDDNGDELLTFTKQ